MGGKIDWEERIVYSGFGLFFNVPYPLAKRIIAAAEELSTDPENVVVWAVCRYLDDRDRRTVKLDKRVYALLFEISRIKGISPDKAVAKAVEAYYLKLTEVR